MISIIDYTQPTPNFGVRVKPAQKSPKIGKYFEKIGINTNRAMIGGLTTTAGAAAVSLAKPDLISNPEFVKLGLVGGIAAVLGSMIPMVRTRKTDVAQNDTDMIAKAKAEAEAKAKAEQKALAKAEKIEKRLAHKAKRQQARDNAHYRLRNSFRKYCKFHYENWEVFVPIMGTIGSFGLVTGLAAAAGIMGWTFPIITLSLTAIEGITLGKGKKYGGWYW